MQLSERDFNNEIRLTGSVALYRQENVGFEVNGRVLLVLDLGKEVQGPTYDGDGRLLRPGDVIAKLDDTRQHLRVQGIRARLKSLQKQLEAKQMQLEAKQIEAKQIEANQVAQANLKAAQARLRGAKNQIEAEQHEARVAIQLFVLGPPVQDPVAFRLSGSDHDFLRRKAREMFDILQQTPGTRGVHSDWGTTGYQVEVRVDPYAANLAGVTNADIALTTRSLLSGARLTTYREGDHQVPVVLRTPRERRQGVNDLSGIFVSGQFGKVPLNSVAQVVPSWEPAVIRRRNNLPTVTVAAQVEEGVLPNKVSAQIKKDLEQMARQLPAGYRLEEGGEHEETEKAQEQVSAALLIALILIILTLVMQFNSIRKLLVILFTLPLALIGALLGLYITGWALGFMAMLGIVALMGIVINNAIVLIDFIEQRVAEGQSLRSAVVVAGRLRFRPIMLTTLTTIGGLLPLSLYGGPLWAPMTNTMIFGLMVATVLTLVIIPTMYVFCVEKLGMRVM